MEFLFWYYKSLINIDQVIIKHLILEQNLLIIVSVKTFKIDAEKGDNAEYI